MLSKSLELFLLRALILSVILLFVLFNCSDESNKSGVGLSNNQGNIQLSGYWSGVLKGIPIHFHGDPNITLELSQKDSIITGTVSTSDIAFLPVGIHHALFKDSLVTFSAIQTKIYPGATIKFMAKVEKNYLDGDWSHNQVHTGKWSA